MKQTTLDLLACPTCHGRLDFSGADEKIFHAGTLACSRCEKHFLIVDGIPHFIEPEKLTGLVLVGLPRLLESSVCLHRHGRGDRPSRNH
jgi:uncharacterized protein YbaR (Trm112 family)